MTEKWALSAKCVFQWDMQGSVAKSTHAGIPWLRYLRRHARLEKRVFFWPFDGFTPLPGRSHGGGDAILRHRYAARGPDGGRGGRVRRGAVVSGYGSARFHGAVFGCAADGAFAGCRSGRGGYWAWRKEGRGDCRLRWGDLRPLGGGKDAARGRVRPSILRFWGREGGIARTTAAFPMISAGRLPRRTFSKVPPQAFTRVTACLLAESPCDPLDQRLPAASSPLPPPIATGWSDTCRAGINPHPRPPPPPGNQTSYR